MQKVYLLLRNNQQSGPYDLEELLQLQLKPFDLVWVHGRSAAWQYPGEIPSLKPYMPVTPQPEAPFQPITTAAMEQQQSLAAGNFQDQPIQKKVFVSMPRTSPRQVPAERNEIPKHTESEPVMENLSGSYHPVEEHTEAVREARASSYIRPLDDEEGSFKKWDFGQTKKKKAFRQKDLVITIVLGGMIAGGYYLLSKPSIVPGTVTARKSETSPVVQPVAEEKKEVKQESKPDAGIISNNEPSVPPVIVNSNVSAADHKKHRETASSKTVVKINTVKDADIIPDNIEITPDVVSKPEVPESKKPADTKKKKLGEVIKNIFTTKKKNEEPKNTSVVLEEPRPATDRKAARREDPPASSNTTTQTDKKTAPADEGENSVALADMIDITSNAPDNWMMGISGLKITLRNRSNVTIQTAAVNVLYYDENNKLLDRKMVYFNRIAPKGKVTQAAPDHKWADHVEFKLSAVSAKEDRYVSNK